jgi:ribonuclease P protein subunit POP4
MSDMITRQNLLYCTFIDLKVEIVKSSQKSLIGLNGKVTDETKNMIVIEKYDGNEVHIPKISCTFRFTTDDGDQVDVEGSKITFRPHERAKKV